MVITSTITKRCTKIANKKIEKEHCSFFFYSMAQPSQTFNKIKVKSSLNPYIIFTVKGGDRMEGGHSSALEPCACSIRTFEFVSTLL